MYCVVSPVANYACLSWHDVFIFCYGLSAECALGDECLATQKRWKGADCWMSFLFVSIYYVVSAVHTFLCKDFMVLIAKHALGDNTCEWCTSLMNQVCQVWYFHSCSGARASSHKSHKSYDIATNSCSIGWRRSNFEWE